MPTSRPASSASAAGPHGGVSHGPHLLEPSETSSPASPPARFAHLATGAPEPGEGAWLLVRLLGGFALGLGLIQLAAAVGFAPAAWLVGTPALADGAAVLLGLALIEVAVHTPWGRACERAVRRLDRRRRRLR